MADCKRPGCTRPEHTRGYCDPHYRRYIRMRIYGYRDASRAREHILRLRDLGWTYEQIADTAGLSTWVPHKLATGQTRHLLPESERALLSLPAVPRPSHRGVDGTGTYRRLSALQWLGWPPALIAARIGLKTYTLATFRSRGEPVSYRVAHAMAALYEELSGKPGPSQQTATKARRRGYAPPAAWDDDTIDDPTAEPAGLGDEEPVSRSDRYRELRDLKVDRAEAARRAGISPHTAYILETQRQRRAG